MEVYLLNESFDTIGIIDKCITYKAVKRFFSPGEFEMHLCGDVTRFRSAFAIYEPFSKSCYLIEGIEGNDKGTSKLFGRSLEALLEKRILDGSGCYVGGAEESVRLAVQRNISGERSLSGLVLGDVTGLAGEGYFKTDYRNLSEFVYSSLRPFGGTYSVELVDNSPTFKVITGRDRTRSQSKYPPVTFSESMGNVKLKNMKLDVADRKNVAYVTGSDRRSVAVTLTDILSDRREMYVNARDVSPSEFENDEEYFNALRFRGFEALARCGGEWKYMGNIVGARYGADYLLGDICDIDTTLGMTFSERITSVKFDFKNGEVNVTASFGEDENSLGSMVREYVNALL